MRKKRKHDPRLIRSRRTYSFREIAELLNAHVRTVQLWKKFGLKILDDNSKPMLVLGQDLKNFIKSMNMKRKHPLKPDEFYCPKCRTARLSLPDRIKIVNTNKLLGKTSFQIIIKGICETCGTKINRFSSQKLTECQQGLISQQPPSLNTDIVEVK